MVLRCAPCLLKVGEVSRSSFEAPLGCCALVAAAVGLQPHVACCTVP